MKYRGEIFQDLTGRCRPCANRRRGVPTRIELIELSSGGMLKRDPHNSRRAWVTCPDCPEPKEERYVLIPPERSKQFQDYTGRCPAHANLFRRELRRKKYAAEGHTTLLSGGTVRRDPDNPKYGWVTCPEGSSECEGERYVFVHFGKSLRNLTGVCRPCLGWRRRRTERDEHPSGALVRRDERDPSNSRRVVFICPNPKKQPGCLGKSYAWLKAFDDPDYCGLCENCQGNDPPNKIKKDLILKDGPDGTDGTQILYSQDEGQRVRVRYWQCGHTQPLTRQTIAVMLSRHRLGKRRWPPRCHQCFLNPDALAERIAAEKLAEMGVQAHPQNSNVQEKGDAQKIASSRKGGRERKLTDQKVLNEIDALGSRVSVSALARNFQCSRATINNWVHDKGYPDLASFVEARRGAGV